MNSVEEYNCVFCKEIFSNREDLQTHFRKHGDPNFNQSNKSQGEASSSKKLNEQEEVGCDVCTEVFPTISKAITHKHKVHPDHDTKYFCPWCGKLFTLKHLYTKHLQANHENAERYDHRTLHCDCCNVDFYCQAALMSHNKFFHRQDELPMVGQSKKLKLYDKEVVQIHYCSFCGEEYENKVNLHKHIKDEHGDENQSPDDILRCPLCDAIFFHLDAYEVHLTFHSVEDIYTEKNEMFNEVTEFSLESIPPICEKVESYLPQDDAETAINAIGIENFLELAMGNEGNETSRHKKKHKKHKKSKKAAITLDEFLNMNSDVFGEGLDIQGVEEVPTQAISKRLKVKQPQNVSRAKLNPELEKLKKQGIVIKKNTIPNDISHLKQTIKISPQAVKNIKAVQVKKQNDPLSKLISQNQNELKIVRKSSQEKPAQIKDNEELLSANILNDPNENKDGKNSVNNGLEANQSNNRIDNDKNTSVEPMDETPSEMPSPTPDSDINNKSSSEINTNHITEDEDRAVSASIIAESDKKSKPLQLQNVNQVSNVANGPTSPFNSKKEYLQPDSLNLLSKTENDTNLLQTGMDYEQNLDESKIDTKKSPRTSVNNSLSALKHLSHLITIKPVNSRKGSPDLKNIDTDPKNFPDAADHFDESDTESPMSTMNEENKPVFKKTSIDNRMANTLKNLKKNVTIKTVGQVPKNANISTSSDEEHDEIKGIENEPENLVGENSDEKSCITTSCETTFTKKSTTKIPKQIETFNDKLKLNKIIKEETEPDDFRNLDEDSRSQTNQDILKRLTNITAKPVKNTPNQIVPANTTPQNKTKITKQINEDNIEVFNIEDSDSDEMDDSRNIPSVSANPAPKTKEFSNNDMKHISVKPGHQQQTVNKSFTKTITKSQIMHNEKQSYHNEESFNRKEYRQVKATKCINTKTVAETAVDEKSLAIKNVLKSLGKNITIKSRTSSPSQSIKSQDNDSQDSYIESKGDDSDVDSEPGNVKITEIDPNASEDEIASGDETKNNDCEQNMSIQSPHSSENSDHEHHNENFGEQDDIESQIRATKLEKTRPNNQKTTPSQNIKKNYVKPASSDHVDPEEEPSSAVVPFIPKNLGSQISVKPVKQKVDSQNENAKNIKQVNASTSNQITSNQRMSNQMNTVNKAVTVKTFQTETETVIEEITTTVTKTIKTVKQEMKNTSHCSSSVVVPQKVQGIRPSQMLKNYQGTKVKQMPPSGLRIRNPTQVRPAICGPIRPTNQMVSPGAVRASTPSIPVRPKANVARLSTPRMPANKNSVSSTSIQAGTPRKPIKISPNAGSVSAKRVNTDDGTGPFSCFKKPKESLIPVSEVCELGGAGHDGVQYSASQVNKSNFVSTTKTVKGNTVVSQMKSESSASSQQLSKLNSVSGLKVVKTSQAKQTIVQEKSEITTPKRTLEAIEKLQKSGLLVKKPRLEVNEESDHSERDDDDAPYGSADEADE